LGCDQDPPSLSTKVIRNLGESFCKLSPEYLTDDALKKRKTTKKPSERKRLFRRWSGRSSPRLSQLKAVQMDARSSRKRRPQISEDHPLEGISITEYSLRLTLISYLNLALLRDSIYFLYVIMADNGYMISLATDDLMGLNVDVLSGYICLFNNYYGFLNGISGMLFNGETLLLLKG
jgi:hypothetical protein